MRVKVGYRSASREVYRRFLKTHPESTLDYTTWANIIYSFNYAFRDYALETGHKCKFPYGFGEFAITKWRPRKTKTLEDGREVISLPIDWKKSREYGKKIYHMNFTTEGFKFKWQWFIYTARFKKADIWMFKPSRVTSRLLKHYLTIPDQQYTYQEWIK